MQYITVLQHVVCVTHTGLEGEVLGRGEDKVVVFSKDGRHIEVTAGLRRANQGNHTWAIHGAMLNYVCLCVRSAYQHRECC